MNQAKLKILLSPFFIFCLLILLINDFFLKAQFHNFLTGKLSDFAGLFVFSLFLLAFFPKGKFVIFPSVIVLFLFWKSQFSQPLIDYWNSFEILRINRTIDYTDLAALFVLPVVNICSSIKLRLPKIFLPKYAQRTAIGFIVLLSVFAFTATSYEDDRTVSFNKKYVYEGSKEDFDIKLRQLNSVSNIDISNTKEMFKGAEVANSISPNEYSYTFTINKKICDSNSLQIFGTLHAEKDLTRLENFSAHFWCKQKPTPEIEAEAWEIFEREFITPSGITPIVYHNENDK